MTTVRELVTRLGWSSDDSKVKNYDQAIKRVRNTTLAVVGATSAAATAVFAFTRSMARAGNEVAKSAVETGMAVGEFQELQFVMGRISQVSEGELTRALATASSAIQRARSEGGRYEDELKRLGFTMQDISRGTITTSDVFDRIASKSQNAATQAEAVSAASALFGERIARRLVPALQRADTDVDALRERFAELGGGFSEAGAAASEEFEDAMFDLQTIFKSIRIEVAERLIPVITKIIGEFTEWLKINREFIEQRLFRSLEIVTRYLGIFWRTARGVWRTVDDLVNSFTTWETVLRAAGFAFIIAQVFKLAKAIGPLGAAFMAMGKGVFLLKAGLLVLAGLVADDIWAWTQGHDSAIGRILGDFDEFSRRVSVVYEEIKAASTAMGAWFMDVFERMGRALDSFKERLRGILPDWLQNFMQDNAPAQGRTSGFLGTDVRAIRQTASGIDDASISRDPRNDLRQSNGSRTTNHIETNVTADIHLPTSTPEEQQNAVRATADKLFDQMSQELNKQITDSVTEFRAAE